MNEKHNNKYSVLMSVYYKEKPLFLRKSIESVMNQTIPPDDFVIVCDGPLTDELYSELEKLVLRYPIINLSKREKNEGLGSALSFGINITKNDIIMRMDSDDICVYNRAEIQLPLMNKYDLVGGFISEFENEENNIIGIRKVPEYYKEILKFSKTRSPFNHPSVMFNRKCVLKAGNYQTLLYLEDYYLWVRILEQTDSVYNVQSVLVKMRSGVSMRSRRGGKTYKQSIKALRRYMLEHKMINSCEYCLLSLAQNILLNLKPKIKNICYKLFLRDK